MGFLVAVDDQKGKDREAQAAEGTHPFIDRLSDKVRVEEDGGVVDEHGAHGQQFHDKYGHCGFIPSFNIFL